MTERPRAKGLGASGIERSWRGPRTRRAALSLLEVLISMAVLLVGVVIIAMQFPRAILAKTEVGYKTRAILLAQAKAQEIRRDNNTSNTLIAAIQSLTAPTPPIVFPEEPNLAYQFSSVSLIDPDDDPASPDDDPRDDPGVARVIVRYADGYRPSQDILYELRFDR